LRAAVAALRPVAHAAEVAVVLETRYDLVRPLGCDGAEVAAEDATLRAARRSLGDDHILGADCRDSRHLGMLAGELGADYVGFSAEAADTLAWWAEVMEVPAVARGGITLETAPALIAAGVDFLALEEAVWQHPDGPAAAVAAFTALCADAAG
jgi:thiamine-phosphate pyrophosphorylase